MIKNGGRFSLALKLNALIIAAIVITTVGLVLASGTIYTITIDSVYSQEADKILDRITRNMDPEEIHNLKKTVETEEYQTVLSEALEKNDVRIVKTWLRHQPSHFADDEQFDSESPEETLYSDYLELYSYLVYAKRYSTCERLFLMFSWNGDKYLLADADIQALGIGTADHTGPAMEDYDREKVQKGIFFLENGTWHYMKGAPIVRTRDDGETVPVCLAGVVFDVDTLVRGRAKFILHSVLIAAGLITLVIAVSTFLLRRSVIFPLRKLAQGALAFGREDRKLSSDDIIPESTRSRDEIGDLYGEIRSMQERIVNYTVNLEKITAEQERVETELRMAASIQEAMLPNDHASFSERPEFDLAACMDPAKEVGGDFYDYFMIDDDHLAVLIADVSEKGVPASLFMMASKILIGYRTKLGGSPKEILEAVNDEIFARNESKMFITVWIGILDIRTGRMVCSNAGHEYPEIRGEDGLFHMFKDEHGLVMGIRKGMTYTDYELVLNPGDAVFVYTDGVTDAKNRDGQFYGTGRIETVLNEKPRDKAEEIIADIREDMDRFVNGAEQFDDITMLCLIYHGPEGTEA